MKAQDAKRAFKTNFPNFSVINKADSKVFRTVISLVSERAKFNVDFEDNWLFRKPSVRDAELRS